MTASRCIKLAIVLIVCAISLLLSNMIDRAAARPVQSGPMGARTTCPAEDSPRWNWAECGNHKRGIAIRTTNQYGETIYRIKVVTVDGYCRYWRESKIYRPLTVPLKGDPTPSDCRPHIN